MLQYETKSFVFVFVFVFKKKIFWMHSNWTRVAMYLSLTKTVLIHTCWKWKVKVLVAQSCPTLCIPLDCSPPSSSVNGILQLRILEWVAISFFKGASWPRGWTRISHIAGRFFTMWAIREAPLYLLFMIIDCAPFHSKKSFQFGWYI